MSMRPATFSSSLNASRQPSGGSLDPAFADAGGAMGAVATIETRAAKPAANSNWVLGSNAAMRRIARSVERAAEVECTVLVSGETGTGKELWARLLHRSGPRQNKAFVPVNCAA
jgi:DNA-binding NtrC family response regulator